MDSLSHNILSVLLHFSVLFSKPSWRKALTLLLGTLLCTGKRTVCSALRAMGLGCESGFSKYHHLLNRAEWSSLKAAKILFFMLLALVSDKLALILFIDETLERRRGKQIHSTLQLLWAACLGYLSSDVRPMVELGDYLNQAGVFNPFPI